MRTMRKVVIVGAGQAGLQLAFGPVRGGYDVTVCHTGRSRTSSAATSARWTRATT